jgi:sigma-E factor negative regulatory protein RseC
MGVRTWRPTRLGNGPGIREDEGEIAVREVGRVVSVSADGAVVGMEKSGACEKCGLCMASSDGREVLLLARNDAEAQPGDAVEVEISPGRVLVAAFALYLLPVLLTIVGFAVGSYISRGNEDSPLPIVLAVVFLIVSFVAAWLFDLRVRKSDRPEATVTRVLSGDEKPPHIEVVKFGG